MIVRWVSVAILAVRTRLMLLPNSN